MSNENFLYQINFNRKKYPEVCKRLEEAKVDNGIAWYLRELIEKDIREREQRQQEPAKIELAPIAKEEINMEPEIITIRDKSLLPDDSGGFA